MVARSLYVCRPLTNGADLHEWAALQGFKSALPSDDLHVTIAFSREPFDWSKLANKGGSLRIEGGNRSVERLGDAIVLRFASSKLKERWQGLRNAGASWDYPGYKPHVTISYKGAPPALDSIEPYDGPLVFGAERFAEVDEDADSDIGETQLSERLNVKQAAGIVAKRRRAKRKV